MSLEERISASLSLIVELHPALAEAASQISIWCAAAPEGEMREFELAGWWVAARKEGILKIIVAPAVSVSGVAIFEPGANHKVIELQL